MTRHGMLCGVWLLGWAAPAVADAGFDHDHRAWSVVLEAVVDGQGRVDYAALKADPQPLQHYLSDLAAVTPEVYRSWTREQQLACLINLYNASTLAMVARHYPVASIKDIGTLLRGPWGQPSVAWMGRATTLDYLQHQLIRPLFADSRTHFALVCAARSAPALRREPFRADRLEQQLDEQRAQFLADPTKNRLEPGGDWILSPVFDWYAGDFQREASTIEAYVRRAWPDSLDASGATNGAARIRYASFDWRLNTAETPHRAER